MVTDATTVPSASELPVSMLTVRSPVPEKSSTTCTSKGTGFPLPMSPKNGAAERTGWARFTKRIMFVEVVEPEDSSCRSEEHTSELQSRFDLVCRLLLEKKK